VQIRCNGKTRATVATKERGWWGVFVQLAARGENNG